MDPLLRNKIKKAHRPYVCTSVCSRKPSDWSASMHCTLFSLLVLVMSNARNMCPTFYPARAGHKNRNTKYGLNTDLSWILNVDPSALEHDTTLPNERSTYCLIFLI